MELSQTKVQPTNLTRLLNNKKFDKQMNIEAVKTQLAPGFFYFSLLPAKCFSILKSKMLTSYLQQTFIT